MSRRDIPWSRVKVFCLLMLVAVSPACKSTPPPPPPPPAPVCGNGTIETGEDCDDGNTSSRDLCAHCRRTTDDLYTLDFEPVGGELAFNEACDGTFIAVSTDGEVIQSSVQGTQLTKRVGSKLLPSIRDVRWSLYDHDRRLAIRGYSHGILTAWFIDLAHDTITSTLIEGQQGVSEISIGSMRPWNVTDVPESSRVARVAALRARGVPADSGWYVVAKDANDIPSLVDVASKVSVQMRPLGYLGYVFRWNTPGGYRILGSVEASGGTHAAFDVAAVGLPGEPVEAPVRSSGIPYPRDRMEGVKPFFDSASRNSKSEDVVWGVVERGPSGAIINLTRTVTPGSTSGRNRGPREAFVEGVAVRFDSMGSIGTRLLGVDPERRIAYVLEQEDGSLQPTIARVSLDGGAVVRRKIDLVDGSRPLVRISQLDPTTRAFVFLASPDVPAIADPSTSNGSTFRPVNGSHVHRISDIDAWLDAQ